MDKDKLLKGSKTFCMLPFMHLHTWPNGNAYPCCMAPPENPLANQKDMTIEELYNCDELKQLRLDVVSGTKSDYCTRCYELEESGVESYRFWANTKWKHHFDLVETMTEDGTVNEMKLPYIDFRFSNLCNLKCRTCGPELSSAWSSDHEKIWNVPKGEGPGLIRPEKELNELFAELDPLLDDLEEIYFAGGEPLLMDEHYFILDKLIARGRTDILIRYNTNFTKFSYRGKSAFEYWKQFPNVKIDASLDAMGQRGEYMRKGLRWDKVEEAITQLKTECPHVEFGLSPTLSVFNALHIVDFHNYMVEKGFIHYYSFNINILLEPEKYRIQILTPALKAQCIETIERQIEMLTELGTQWEDRVNPYRFVIERYRTVISYLNQKDPYDHLIGKFNYITNTLDNIRRETFVDVFPELKGLMHD